MDKTTTDLNRRELDFNRNFVEEVLPSYFAEEYPNLIKFLEYYLEFLKEQGTGTISLDELKTVRDITQTNEELLKYIENELLLGENYFQGFTDKRAAAQYSSILYRTKGSRYSIQQFFRTFYGIDPEIVYTKNNVFHVYGEGQTDSLIGSESEKFLLNDKLYQTYALLIKVPLPSSVWNEAYKLFVHPAGFYFGAQVQLTSTTSIDITTPTVELVEPLPVVASESTVSITPLTDITGIVADDSDSFMRIKLDETIQRYVNLSGTDSDSLASLEDINNQYESLEEVGEATSPTFDDDSAVGKVSIDTSNVIETMDQDRYLWWDSDSDGYVNQINFDTNL